MHIFVKIADVNYSKILDPGYAYAFGARLELVVRQPSSKLERPFFCYFGKKLLSPRKNFTREKFSISRFSF